MNDDQALRDFVAKYARPYDSETDDYDRPPFAIDVRSAGRSNFYNLHYYHTKVPPEVIRGFILNYTDPGDLVLDPFAGSGMTGAACLMCGNVPSELVEFISGAQEGIRRCILNDLSPAACHIAYNYTTSVDSGALRAEFDRIRESVRAEFDWLYGTEHYEPAVGLYDPKQPEVAERLKNPPPTTSSSSKIFDNGPVRTWQLLDRIEVESRLGYPVSSLLRDKERDALNISTIDKWICIPAIIQHTVWSDVYRCEGLITLEEPTGKISTRGRNLGKPIVRRRRVRRGCGRNINLWESAVDPSTGEVAELVSCPHCHQDWKKVQLERTHSVPVQVTYRFEGLKALKSGIVIGQTTRSRPTSKLDRDHIKAVANQPIPTSFQDEDIDLGREMMRHGLLKRGVKRISDFWCCPSKP
jgi:hypothetical protein